MRTVPFGLAADPGLQSRALGPHLAVVVGQHGPEVLQQHRRQRDAEPGQGRAGRLPFRGDLDNSPLAHSLPGPFAVRKAPFGRRLPASHHAPRGSNDEASVDVHRHLFPSDHLRVCSNRPPDGFPIGGLGPPPGCHPGPGTTGHSAPERHRLRGPARRRLRDHCAHHRVGRGARGPDDPGRWSGRGRSRPDPGDPPRPWADC